MISTSTATIYMFSSLLMGVFALFAFFLVIMLFVLFIGMPLRGFWRIIKSFLNPNIGHK